MHEVQVSHASCFAHPTPLLAEPLTMRGAEKGGVYNSTMQIGPECLVAGGHIQQPEPEIGTATRWVVQKLGLVWSMHIRRGS
jgi:hypothetical protein